LVEAKARWLQVEILEGKRVFRAYDLIHLKAVGMTHSGTSMENQTTASFRIERCRRTALKFGLFGCPEARIWKLLMDAFAALRKISGLYL